MLVKKSTEIGKKPRRCFKTKERMARIIHSTHLILLAAILATNVSAVCTNGMWIDRTWIPAPNCELFTYDRYEVGQCLNNKTIVFAGNSVTRHLFDLFSLFLKDIPDDESEKARRAEKARIFELEHAEEKQHPHHDKRRKLWFWNTKKKPSYHATEMIESREEQCRPKKEGYGKHFNWCMDYNANFPYPVTDSWSVDPSTNSSSSTSINSYHGKVSFLWLYDWYSPALLQLLQQPNTVITTTAGLNWYWASINEWESAKPIDVVKRQFPVFWNSTIHDSARVIVRQITRTCIDDQPFLTDKYIEEYIQQHPRHTHDYLPLDELTTDRLHYNDCTHHAGPVAYTTLTFLFNMICGSPSSPGTKKTGKEESRRRIDRNVLLGWYNNSMVYVTHAQPTHAKQFVEEPRAQPWPRTYYWLVNNHRILIPNDTFYDYIFKRFIGDQARVYPVSSPFLTYIPETHYG